MRMSSTCKVGGMHFVSCCLCLPIDQSFMRALSSHSHCTYCLLNCPRRQLIHNPVDVRLTRSKLAHQLLALIFRSRKSCLSMGFLTYGLRNRQVHSKCSSQMGHASDSSCPERSTLISRSVVDASFLSLTKRCNRFTTRSNTVQQSHIHGPADNKHFTVQTSPYKRDPSQS